MKDVTAYSNYMYFLSNIIVVIFIISLLLACMVVLFARHHFIWYKLNFISKKVPYQFLGCTWKLLCVQSVPELITFWKTSVYLFIAFIVYLLSDTNHTPYSGIHFTVLVILNLFSLMTSTTYMLEGMTINLSS